MKIVQIIIIEGTNTELFVGDDGTAYPFFITPDRRARRIAAIEEDPRSWSSSPVAVALATHTEDGVYPYTTTDI